MDVLEKRVGYQAAGFGISYQLSAFTIIATFSDAPHAVGF